MTASDGGAGPTVTHSIGPGVSPIVRRLELHVIEGPQQGLELSSESDRMTIGSHPRCELVIDDPTVSRFHCEIRVDDRRARVHDMGSRNGTVIDGVSVIDAYLRNGCRLQLGRTVVRIDYGTKSTRLKLSAGTAFGRMVGESVAMRATFALLEKAAASDATVLLEGETGTGKTLAARSLHEAGARRDGPFVVVDCGAIPANLLESELFGHEKGAFTGAEARRIGAFEEADGGTLFLDEIGELPLDLQPKLLRVLEDRTVRRVGSSKTESVDVRVIVATNRDLRAEVNDGRFRSDLFYRVAVVTIGLPALRERRDDLPVLAQRTLESLGADPLRVEALLTPELRAQLARSAWPGNVRQLRNYLERCLVFDEVLPVAEPESSSGSSAAQDYSTLPYSDAKQRAIDDFERAYLQTLLSRHDRVADAAAEAGIDRTYFYRLLRRHRLNK